MNQDYHNALRKIRGELHKHEAKFTSIGSSLIDDCTQLKSSNDLDRWALETTQRRIHQVITRPIANLPMPELYQLAIHNNTKAIWQMPSQHHDTIPNRRRLLAHAMKGIVHKILATSS